VDAIDKRYGKYPQWDHTSYRKDPEECQTQRELDNMRILTFIHPAGAMK
jgi:hypothetical protein